MTKKRDDSSEREMKVKAGLKSRTLKVDYLARVEGEGAMYIKTEKGKVVDVQLNIFEPPRFFEAFLRSRELTEAPDITARICGICPVAYQISSVNAMEQGLGIELPYHVEKLRRLMYCGEWIESHTLHVLMLHAPDFLGCLDVVQLTKEHKEMVLRGLKLKKAGNKLIDIIAGREIHPINMRVGGFYSMPSKASLKKLIEPFKEARDYALDIVKWVAGFEFPHLEREYEFVSTYHEEEYPFAKGRIRSSSGLDIAASEYDERFKEEHVEHSTALHCTMVGKGAYLCGPMARYNLAGHLLSPLVQEAITSIGFEKKCINPFRSIIVRALEVLYACDEALRILEEYDWERLPAYQPLHFKNVVGYGVSEAPRGLLYHRYRINDKGLIEDAKIVAPTTQNQKCIEEDLFEFVSANQHLSDEELTWKCEQAIRNYDPCISCSTHFLKLQRVCG